MNILKTIEEQFRHMQWADALVWQVVGSSDAALADETMRVRLHHIHAVQRAFLTVWRNQQLDFEAGSNLRGADLAAWGRDYHREARQYLSELSESDLDRPVALPWVSFIADRIGKEPQTPTLGETLLQVAAHSAYHRGQVNAGLRALGVEPPLVDFIAWVWLAKPDTQWHIGTVPRA